MAAAEAAVPYRVLVWACLGAAEEADLLSAAAPVARAVVPEVAEVRALAVRVAEVEVSMPVCGAAEAASGAVVVVAELGLVVAAEERVSA